jgi:serine/threonine-protein kinase
MKYLHSQNIILRDLKPTNVGFDIKDDAVKLFDFGLACHGGECNPGEIVGSLRYMSPESMQGKQYSPRKREKERVSHCVFSHMVFIRCFPF